LSKYTTKIRAGFYIAVADMKAIKDTSLFRGGYLPNPGVADAAVDTMPTSIRCTCPKTHIFHNS
jgi:hypothetical protein